MFSTTKDILYIVLSLSILLVTAFACWVIYYIAMILREFKKMASDIRQKIELIEKLAMAIKEKIEHTSSYVKLLMESVVNVMEFVKDRKTEKQKNKKK